MVQHNIHHHSHAQPVCRIHKRSHVLRADGRTDRGQGLLRPSPGPEDA